ncbi:MAG: hypothetical protein QXZ19_04875, partial [Thermoplasmata archaeon]
MSQNDGASEYEQRRTVAGGGDQRAFGYYANTADTDRGLWRDTLTDAILRFSGGANPQNGLAVRAWNAGHASGDYYHARINGNTLQLYRVNGGTFTLVASDSAGASIPGTSDHLLSVAVWNVPDPNGNASGSDDTDHVRLLVHLYNGTTP